MRLLLVLNDQPVRCTHLTIRFEYAHADDTHPARYRLSYRCQGRRKRRIVRALRLDVRPSGRILVVAQRKRD